MKALALVVLASMLGACVATTHGKPCTTSRIYVWCAFAKCDVKQTPETVTPLECRSMSTPEETAAQLRRIVDLLSILYEPEEAAQWMRTPQPLLDDARPLDLFGTEAGLTRVIEVLERASDAAHL